MKEEKRAIVTISIGDRFSRIANVTHPTLKTYANRINADFICINEESETPHWEKLKLYDLLVKYDRIIYLDTDIIIRDDCPNLFDIIPIEKIGMFNEGRFSPREASLREAYNEYNKQFPIKWNSSYYNTGVMVLSRRHRHLFFPPTKIVNMGMLEQGYLNMLIIDQNIQIEELDYKFNRMTIMDEYTGITRKDSYIIHYAGAPTQFDIVTLIKSDLEEWEKKKYDYERNIILYSGGGLGDQLCSEPVFRFIIKNMFKDRKTKYTIISHWPKLFEHLDILCMTRQEYDEKCPILPDNPVRIMKSLPDPEENLIWRNLPHILSHSTDYSSICTINKTIPDLEKTIMLKVSLNGISEVMDISNPKEMILVHPGRGWKSKTFPAEWWNTIIQNLVNSGKKVGIIGKHISDEQGYVNVEVPEGVVDFRDLLSLDGLIGVIAMAKMVISNDSAPIHIAGAFDNQILLISTCKHPDHVLPYRKGNKYYKAFAFAKKLTIDEWDLSPTRIFKETADKIKGDILDYLPTPEEVVSKAIEMIENDEQKQEK